MSEEQRQRIHETLQQYNIKFSGCHIFQISNPLQNIRMFYGDVKVCFVRLPSTTLLFDKIYSDYCSIVLYLIYTQNPYIFNAPLLRVYFIDGLKEGWETEVVNYIQSDTKETLVVLESVFGQEESQIHYDRIERILNLINRDVPKDDKKNETNKADQSPVQ